MFYSMKNRLMGQVASIYTPIKNIRLLSQKALVGSWLNFFDHIETALYLALGPLFIFDQHEYSNLWILGLLSSGLGKLLFSFIWSILFRYLGLRPILIYSWLGLALSSLSFGLYGLWIGPHGLSILVVMMLRFSQSLCSSAQMSSCRAWIFTDLKRESAQALQTSAFFGFSTPLGMMSGLGIVFMISFYYPLSLIWPWIYITISMIALGISYNLWKYITSDPISHFKAHWPKLREIAICSLISSFGHCTYYWACVFLPLQACPQNPLGIQIKALAYDSLLMIPLGLLSTVFGSSQSVRLSTIGCLIFLLLCSLGYIDTYSLRWAILILGVLCTCAHGAWLKNHLQKASFFPSSLIGSGLGSLIGSASFYWAQQVGQSNLLAASAPFALIGALLAGYNEISKTR